jgi:hypothetical protein
MAADMTLGAHRAVLTERETVKGDRGLLRCARDALGPLVRVAPARIVARERLVR